MTFPAFKWSRARALHRSEIVFVVQRRVEIKHVVERVAVVEAAASQTLLRVIRPVRSRARAFLRVECPSDPAVERAQIFPRAGNVHFQQLLVRLRAEDVQRTADLLRGQLEFAAPMARTVPEDRVATADGLDIFCDDRFCRRRPGGSCEFGPRLRRLHRQTIC